MSAVDTRLLDTLQKTLDNPPTGDFSNWLHKDEPKQEFLWALASLRESVNPGVIRYIMQYAYQAGLNSSPATADSAQSESGAGVVGGEDCEHDNVFVHLPDHTSPHNQFECIDCGKVSLDPFYPMFQDERI